MNAQHIPEISVIVPVYRVERFLTVCVDSILGQTFRDFELILVDDGSPDGCPALCDAAARRDDRVRVIHQKNRGLSGARNAGLDIARGNWIAFVDSDDRVQSAFLERLHRAAQDADADAAICGTFCMREDGTLYPSKQGDGYASDEMIHDEVLTGWEAINRLPLSAFQVSWNKLYRRQLFDGLRFPEGKRYEDTFTSPLLYQRVRRLACVSQELYIYRIVEGSIMHSKITLQSLDRVEAFYRMFLVMREQHTEDLCIPCAMVLTSLADVWKHLPPADRRSPRMKECIGYGRDAWRMLCSAHGITPRALRDTVVHAVSPHRYLDDRRRRLAKKSARK